VAQIKIWPMLIFQVRVPNPLAQSASKRQKKTSSCVDIRMHTIRMITSIELH